MATLDPWADNPPLFHIGLHKTATTWLQDRVFDNSDSSAFLADKAYLDIIERLDRPNEYDFDARAVRDGWSGFLTQATSAEKVPVITSEELGGMPFHKRFHRRIMCERIAKAFPEAVLLITIREQKAVIRSIYGQFVRYGYFNSLKDFLTEPDPNKGFQGILDYSYYRYDAMLDDLATIFPRNRIVIAPLEKMTTTPSWLTETLSTIYGRPLSPPSEDTGKARVNVATSALAHRIARHGNRFINRDMRWQNPKPRFSPNSLAFHLDRILPQSMKKKHEAEEKALVAEAVGDRYKDSNRRLAEMIDLDLGALGYDL